MKVQIQADKLTNKKWVSQIDALRKGKTLVIHYDDYVSARRDRKLALQALRPERLKKHDLSRIKTFIIYNENGSCHLVIQSEK
jgi:hypothetical protein